MGKVDSPASDQNVRTVKAEKNAQLKKHTVEGLSFACRGFTIHCSTLPRKWQMKASQ